MRVLSRESGGLTAETAPHAAQRMDTSLHSHPSHGRSHLESPAQDKKKQPSSPQHTHAKTDWERITLRIEENPQKCSSWEERKKTTF